MSAEPRPDFEAIFRALPGPHCILDRELRFVDANPSYCAVTERGLDELVGRGMFELFPNEGPAGQRLRASLREVLESGRPDSIALIPYPIPLPKSRGGGFEMRYWSATHLPLNDAEGRTRWVMQHTVDVTELQRLRTIAFGPGEGTVSPVDELDVLRRAEEVEHINRSLARETEGLRDLFMQAPGFMSVLTGPDLRFALVNRAYQQLIGHRQVVGRTLADALPEVVDQGFEDLLRGVMASGEPYIGSALPVLLNRTTGAEPELRYLDFIYQPMTNADGEVWGVFVEGSDVTDRVEAEAQQKLLLDELNHRVKNTLATVQALAHQTLRSSETPAAFQAAFESRLLALSATHDLLTETSWKSADLQDVLAIEFRPFETRQYRLDGPHVDLSPAETVALSLVLHELATNAMKYGALSTHRGWVDVSWRVADGRLALTWREHDGPPVAPPTRRGFGSRLIERSLKGPLGGEASLDYAPGGLVCRVGLPLSVS